jgi:hypothetical protein
VGNRNVPQSEMLQDILGLVFQAEDRDSYPPNVPLVSDFIGVPDKNATFESVGDKFREYVKRYTESYVPLNLQCVHAAGGAHLINDWCRSNRSFGFEQNSLRLSEKAFQSKISKIRSNPTQDFRESSKPIDSQLASAFETRVVNQQPLLSITSGVQQQQQLERE